MFSPLLAARFGYYVCNRRCWRELNEQAYINVFGSSKRYNAEICVSEISDDLEEIEAEVAERVAKMILRLRPNSSKFSSSATIEGGDFLSDTALYSEIERMEEELRRRFFKGMVKVYQAQLTRVIDSAQVSGSNAPIPAVKSDAYASEPWIRPDPQKKDTADYLRQIFVTGLVIMYVLGFLYLSAQQEPDGERCRLSGPVHYCE